MVDLETGETLSVRCNGKLEPALIQLNSRKIRNGSDNGDVNKGKQVPHPFQGELSEHRLDGAREKSGVDEHPELRRWRTIRDLANLRDPFGPGNFARKI